MPNLPSMRFFTTCFIFFLFAASSFAQSSQPDYSTKIVPPSPAMTAFDRYGTYPVDYSSGLAQVSVPVYTIQQSGFSYPINLSFHASGRRANLDFSTTGVGWLMNATGYISREIRERPDGFYPHYDITEQLLNNQNNTGPEYAYYRLRQVDSQIPNPPTNGFSKKDAEFDVYSYNVNGLSGKFIINGGQIVQLTKSNVKIEASPDGPFTITDQNGVRYEFSNTTLNSKETVTMFFDNSQNTINTGWYLSKIMLLSGDVITFTYDTRRTEDQNDGIISPTNSFNVLNYQDQGTSEEDRGNPPAIIGYALGVHTMNQVTVRNYTICYLKSIQFPQGQVTFDYDASSLLLNAVNVYDKNAIKLQTSSLLYMTTPGMPTGSSFSNNNSKSLQYLVQKDANNQPVSQYAFDYYNNAISSSTQNSFQQLGDWWGYSSTMSDKVPVDPNIAPADLQSSSYVCTTCKEPQLSPKLSGMLKSITFPTGGNTTFEYEANQYDYNGLKQGPGIRIKTITSDDGSGINKLIRTFYYGENDNGAGILPYLPNPEDFHFDLYTYIYSPSTGSGETHASYRTRTYTLQPRNDMAEAYQQPITYSKVTEYQQTATGEKLGKTVYRYTVPEYELSSYPPKSFRVKYWMAAKLKAKEIYKYRQPENDYQIIEEERTGYTTLDYISLPQIRVKRNMNTPYDDTYNTGYGTRFVEETVLNLGRGGGHTSPTQIYSAKDYPVEAAVMLPNQRDHFVYDNSGSSVWTQTKYTYDNLKHLLPTKVETSTSQGELSITENKYPDDFYTPSQPVGAIWAGIYNLQQKHVIAPVEVSSYRSNTDGTNKRLLSSSLFFYKQSAPLADSIQLVESGSQVTDFIPSSVQSGIFTKDGRYKSRFYFDSYDNELNLLQKHQSGGVSTVYIWGYGGGYPVAEIRNATYIAVETALGGSAAVATFRDTPIPSDAVVESFLAPLRTATTLKNAQVTTYMYKPLVGMTSVTDIKGMKTTYEYDNSQRLVRIKDNDGNILKAFCYNYAGQQGGCPIATGPVIIPYAKMVHNSSYVGGPDSHTYGIYTFSLYADANGTIPYNVTGPINIQYRLTSTRTITGTIPPTAPQTYDVTTYSTITTGGNSVVAYIDEDTCGRITADAVASAQSSQKSSGVTTNLVPPGGGGGGGSNTCVTTYVTLLSGNGYQLQIQVAQ